MYLNICISTLALLSHSTIKSFSDLDMPDNLQFFYDSASRNLLDSTIERNTRSLYAVCSPSHDARYGFDSNGISRLIYTTLVGYVPSTTTRKREKTICERKV